MMHDQWRVSPQYGQRGGTQDLQCSHRKQNSEETRLPQKQGNVKWNAFSRRSFLKYITPMKPMKGQKGALHHRSFGHFLNRMIIYYIYFIQVDSMEMFACWCYFHRKSLSGSKEGHFWRRREWPGLEQKHFHSCHPRKEIFSVNTKKTVCNIMFSIFSSSLFTSCPSEQKSHQKLSSQNILMIEETISPVT